MRRTLGGFFALAISIAGFLGAAPTPATAVPAPSATAKTYVALGDSYAAGYGLPSKSDAASIACARSNLAYPELLNGYASLKKLTFAACTGALVEEVLVTQLAGLDANTRTVTLTVGGNDLGFGQLTCLASGSCNLSDLAANAAVVLPGLGGKLTALLTAIKTRAPNAKIFVTGYPDLFGAKAKVFGTTLTCPVSAPDRAVINTLVGQLNAVISGSAAVAKAGGAKVTFVSVTKVFDGHGACDSGLPYLSSTLHPNALGQAAYAAALTVKGVTR